jgi:Cd2+/Zn2+-exporting ATPase
MTTAPNEQIFTIHGMDCAGCAKTLERGVAQLKGVQSCEIHFTTERLRVQGEVEREQIVQRVRELGYEVAEPASASPNPSSAEQTPSKLPNFFGFMWQRNETRLALLGALLILPGLIFGEILGMHMWWVDLLALAALLTAGLPIARSAWRAISVSRELNINVLMTIAAIGAVIIGATVEAGMVMVLFAIGEALEGYTSARARHAIRSLMEVAPATAIRLSSASTCESSCSCACSCADEHTHEHAHEHSHTPSEERVPISTLQIGDIILVRPGERLPMDGLVHAGFSSINQAPITGESRLIEKQAGDEVFAGSINGEGSIEIEITRLAADNTINRMIRMVEEAQERRAPVQRFVDQFAKYYTPAVVVIALLVAVIPPLFFAQPFLNPTPDSFGWLYRALALLVVACPCALVISTPVSVISALSAAARNGILIKGGAFLEALAKVKAVAFDKTGTLTKGQPAVVEVRSTSCKGSGDQASCPDCDDLLALAYAVERRSEHPLAYAISQAASTRGLVSRYAPAEQVTALMGRGVSGLVAGSDVLVGSHTYFDTAIAHDERQCQAARADAMAGHTPVLVSVAGSYRGTITMSDTVRPSAQAAIAQLKQAGIENVAMLTGDQQATAQRIGEPLGVTDIRADLLPADKVSAVEALQKQYGNLAMVGDGINDTPALATASVGIAIDAANGGTNQAMETADITLMSDDLRKIPFAIRLSKAAMNTVAVNVVFSIVVKLLFLGLVLTGYGTLWMAVFADVGTSVLVTLNGMRLLRFRDQSA